MGADRVIVGTGRWRLLRIGYRRRQRDIWIHCEVGCLRQGELPSENNNSQMSIAAMTASQMRIAETIDAFYGDAGTRDGVSRSYKQAVEDLDAETIKALDGPYR
jgi:hypothetical protein